MVGQHVEVLAWLPSYYFVTTDTVHTGWRLDPRLDLHLGPVTRAASLS